MSKTPMPAPLDVLNEVFGYAEFRPGQAEVVSAQLEDRDVLSVAPTGSGKSVSYWLPAVLTGGLTLVVSPLIALMKDQVDRLREWGIAAALINSSLDRQLQVRQLEEAEEGLVRLLYVAPERFARPGFLDRIGRLRVRRLVVDEAHCISSWGHDFRPDYRLLGRAVEACGRPPIAAFTATATPRVREDIAQSLGMRDAAVFVTGFNRPNLLLKARRCRGDAGKRQALLEVLDPKEGRVLIYTGTRAACEETAGLVSSRALPAAAYHAGLGDETRRRVQNAFAEGRLKVVVATTAFGMGIDLPDIRQVIHHHLPGSLEGYYQEAGRAGRDGEPADCVLLWSPADRDLHVHFIEHAEPRAAPEVRDAAYARLAQMFGYARLRTCRHARIADYFGESGVARTCGACDNCLEGHRARDAPVADDDVSAALAAAARFSGHIGQANLAAVLGGRQTSWTRRNLWSTELSHFGALPWREEKLRELLSEMVEAGLLRQSSGEYPTVEITRLGREVLRGQARVGVSLPDVDRRPAPRQETAPSAGAAGPPDPALSERLRRWRLDRARRDGVPAYVVFHDRTLSELAERHPQTAAELSRVNGMGPAKMERYATDLLDLLNSSASPE